MIHSQSMGPARMPGHGGASGQALRFGAAALAVSLCLSGCGCDDTSSPAAGVTPTGGLSQETLRGPISFTSGQGWRVAIEDGAVTVKPPAGKFAEGLQYVSQGTREHLGTLDLRTWGGDRRSLLLPGGAKLTLHGQGGQILRLSLYDTAESHEVDVLTQTLLHSKVDRGVARDRDAAEPDGETGQLLGILGSAYSNSGLYLANLYVEPEGADGSPGPQEIEPQPLARQMGDTAYAFTDAGPSYRPQTEAACDEEPRLRGDLTQQDSGRFEYTSRSGRWSIIIDQHTVTLTRHIGTELQARWQVWGDPHENLNGKHIKDWEGSRRTLLLDDGTKVTLHADGPQRVVHTTSIYDGPQSHEIGNAGNQLRHSCVHAETAARRDAEEADGETAHLVILRSPASVAGGLFTENIYTEPEEPEEGEAVRMWNPALLGETGEMDINPNRVNDYYDDPRLGHT